MGRLIDANSVYNAIQITTDNFGVAKHVVETNMLDMLAKIPTVEAIPQADYEARLKADLVAMLTELKTEIEEVETFKNVIGWELTPKTPTNIKQDCIAIIQDKINELKENKGNE